MRKDSIGAGIAALLLVFCLAAVPALAAIPGIGWERSLGGSGEEYAKSLQPTNDGGYIAVGDTASADGDITVSYGMIDVWIAKLDAAGQKEWVKTIGGSNDDHVTCIERLSDGTLLLSGYTWSNDGDFSDNHAGIAIWNMKINDQGSILWKGCYPGRSGSFAMDGKETPDGGMIMIGQSYSIPGDPEYHGGYDVLVVKTDSQANITWEQLLGGSGDDFGDNILPLPDGGYIAIGYTNSDDGDVSGNHGFYDAWLFRLDDTGNLVWQKCLGGSLHDEGREIFITPDGNFAVMGYTNSNDGDVSGNHGSFDYWWALVSPDGAILSQKCFGGSDYDHAYDLEMTDNGNYVALGVSYSTDGDVGGNAGNGDFWAVEFDTTGTILWERCFGGSGLDRGQTIRPDSSAGGLFFLIGDSASTDGDVTGNHGGLDYWVVNIVAKDRFFAQFSAEPVTGKAPLTVLFTDRSGGDPAWHVYNFGDGFRSMNKNPVHTYRKAGTYDVSLTVVKVNPNTKKVERDTLTKSHFIVVTKETPVPLIADFSASPMTGTAPLTVRFTDKSTGDPRYFVYEFGDGFKSMSPNPVHIYRKSGTYSVTLTVLAVDKDTGKIVSNSTIRKNLIVVDR
ncbi:MAG TPA: PKD domain-containing protein [Methanolinea sp.]|nr:PKD domain-containing protein [Methanolinea sp.]HQK55115.1 PKD domain-containing protein [Methanolinea sp.]